MAVEAHKCNAKECKGYVVFDNADFNFSKPDLIDGMYQFESPHCTECGKEYKVVPHYTVISVEEDGSIEDVKGASINEFERRVREKEIEVESNPYEKLKKFIALRGYSYSVEEVIDGYAEHEGGAYISYTMKDCVTHLELYRKEAEGNL